MPSYSVSSENMREARWLEHILWIRLEGTIIDALLDKQESWTNRVLAASVNPSVQALAQLIYYPKEKSMYGMSG